MTFVATSSEHGRSLPAPLVLLLVAAVLIVGGSAFFALWSKSGPRSWSPTEPIRLGVLFAQTGPTAANEMPLIDAVTLAVETINAAGGLLGRPLTMVVADSAGSPARAAAAASQLIDQEQAAALIGCWTSNCRQAVKAVVEQKQHLLFYPLQYEGLESSANIIYTGAAPNQQLLPAAQWALDNFGKKVVLVGSDYVFPRIAHRLLRERIDDLDGQVLAEYFFPLDSQNFQALAAQLATLKPDLVLNTLNGDSNRYFFKALQAAGLNAQPMLSFSVAEPELQKQDGVDLSAHYVSWGYFQSLPTEDNRRFVEAFKRRFGQHRVTSDPIEAAYIAVLLWARAVHNEQSTALARVNPALSRLTLKAPSGMVAIDRRSRHLWRHFRVGKARSNGQFEQVFASAHALRPLPFGLAHSRREWDQLTAAVNAELSTAEDAQRTEKPKLIQDLPTTNALPDWSGSDAKKRPNTDPDQP